MATRHSGTQHGHDHLTIDEAMVDATDSLRLKPASSITATLGDWPRPLCNKIKKTTNKKSHYVLIDISLLFLVGKIINEKQS